MSSSVVIPSTPDVDRAAARIAPHVRRTPLLRAEIDGRPVVVKLEHLQRTGSFKLRGATNALLSGEPPLDVVTASGGNHGLAVATAAHVLGIPATVFVPSSAPEGKVRRIAAIGAKVVRGGETYAEAASAARAAAADLGARYVHAYDDPAVVAGQGTAALEILADAPDVDAVAVAVGGGGLAAGTALALDGTRPLFAVEPENCCALHAALAAGGPVDAPVDSVAASALGATRVGRVPFAVLGKADVRSVLVPDREILTARDRLWEELRVAVEPAAAAPFAAWLNGQLDAESPCLVLCGANTDWEPA
ncbi:serine/threonine dehydratase [Longimycelium tulufanense]|uniref:serine/threonine dehydratase n=1 Tax=Longimycelium tulufanense TaxID=907463 RepID=UPI001663603C|nr:serine/threonine dehydratase [Longimycelium tulufanense]